MRWTRHRVVKFYWRPVALLCPTGGKIGRRVVPPAGFQQSRHPRSTTIVCRGTLSVDGRTSKSGAFTGANPGSAELEVLEKVSTSGNLNVVRGEKGLAERVVNLL